MKLREKSEQIENRKDKKEKSPRLLKKAFIVHGHDDATKLKTARFLEKLGFEAIILHEQANGGKTIIEKLEHFTDVGFGIVLYTPDDEGSVKDKKNYQPRARQNVVFEHGLLIGKLGRNKVFPLVTNHSLELPGDINGMVYLSDTNWELQLAKEIRELGYEIDMNKVV
ncbi:putative nucleotide-binding protein [Acinetobacter baylyi]|uniref:nucleotide-binding protein n=1 Tax=Acinetobacter baylyi TaxID=202950 RepID=UPI0028669B64|nr:nucleotide-binding protein [Acinetobacter baylyi]MDR6106627.1 putative nucleotide-binding protein [Acinetobacter baylyi]